MAIYTHRRGRRANLPTGGLKPGEIIVTTDTRELYLADEAGTPQPVKVAASNVSGAGLTNHTYVHNQTIPSDTWVINHDLTGKFPSVTVIDSAGSVVVGDVRYTAPNQVTVTFSAGFSGTAYLN